MTYEEFTDLVETKVSIQDFRFIETVYNFHPSISNTDGKKQIAMLVDTFGMRIIFDMLPTATSAKELDTEIRVAKARVSELQEKYRQLVGGTES